MRRRPETSAARRARLARRIDRLEVIEPRAMITESIGVFSFGIGMSAWAAARSSAGGAETAVGRAESATGYATSPPAITLPTAAPTGGGAVDPTITGKPLASVATGWLTLAPKPNPGLPPGLATPPPSSQAGGGALPSPGSITPLRLPPPGAPTPPPAPQTPSTPAVVSGSASAAQGETNGQTPPAAASAPVLAAPTKAPTGGGGIRSGRSGGGGIHDDFSGPTTPFPVYVLDQNDGTVLFPGADQVATLGGDVDLRAQVRNTTVSSYSWDTTGLTDATSISGSGTYDLTFQWDTSVSAATTNSVTLTVTNASSQTVTQTFTFAVPTGSGATAGTGTATWPESTAPSLELDSAPSFATHNASVDAASGALDTGITLPSYNPNVAPIALTYNSLLASPQPVVVEHHTIDPTNSTEPGQVTAQLTFDGTAGSTYYYDSSTLNPGDVMQVALQANATSLATGRYAYTVTMGDVRGGSTTTTTSSGTATVLNGSGNAFGAGWTLSGLESITAASGGVILDLGEGDDSLWFASSGGSYVTPAGDFSTLVADSGGGYTDTLTDGTAINFNSSGQETSTVTAVGLTTSYGYSGGNLTTITDPYGKVTTFSYSGGYLATITDPASRVATFTHSGADLTGVTLPDSSTWAYGYDSGGHLTQATDPDSKTMTFVYDSGGAVSGTERPDGTSESFAPYQRQGWVAPGDGTSSSPAAATLLAEAAATYTDPNGDTTALRPDWRGQGLVDTAIDPLGNVSSTDRDANGLATIAVDPLNRITRYAYDSHANLTETIYPDGTTSSATYNSLAEPLTTTDELGRTTTNTYNGSGDLTNVVDPRGLSTTMAYNGTGQMTTDSNAQGPLTPPGGPIGWTPGDIGGPVSYTYDSQGRMLTQEDDLGDIITYAYDSAGDVTKVEDANSHTTTSTYDAMGRLLTTENALDETTTYVYDARGNRTVVIDPLGRRTTTSYDAMDRVATVKDPLGDVTSYTYDSGGRLASVTDPDGNVTTYAYDADSRQIGSTDPNGHRATTTYDADGEVVEVVDRDGRQTDYAYDSMGRQTAETWVSGGTTLETISSTYDADGELTEITDGTTVLTYAYDADGNQTEAGTSGGGSGQPDVLLTTTYNYSNKVASLADNLSSAETAYYTYDDAYRLVSITVEFGGGGGLGLGGGGAGPQVQFGYDSGGLVTSVTRSLGPIALDGGTATATTSYTYDAADQVTSITDQYNDGEGDPATALDAQSYTYDSGGEVTSATTAEGTASYTYDSGGELTGVTGVGTATYDYDNNGNRDSTGYATTGGNELTAAPGYTYAYDAEGNTVGQTETSNGDVTTFAYDYRNRLVGETERNSGGTILNQATYTYDPMNRRIGFDDNGTQTWTVYDGQNSYADFNGSGTLEERYMYGPAVDQILARTDSGGTTDWYLTDNLGSVRDVVDTSGNVVDHVAYDAFGNVIAESGGGGDRFKFAGMQLDATTGLYYDQARYYNPVTGRFVSQDPTGFNAGDDNLYRYVDNSPSNTVDSSGLGDFLDWLFPASVTIRPGVVNGPTQTQPGMSTGSSVNITAVGGTFSLVDGVWFPDGYLKIPTGVTVLIAGPQPGRFLPPDVITTGGDVYWYPSNEVNPQGPNPTIIGDVNTTPTKKPMKGTRIVPVPGSPKVGEPKF